MEGAKKVAHYSRLEKARVRKGQMGKQKDEIIHEKFFLKDLGGCEHDFGACAACNHHYVLPVRLNIAEILQINDRPQEVLHKLNGKMEHLVFIPLGK